MKAGKTWWVHVGTIGVDSATVFVGDPAYLRREDHPITAPKKVDWGELLGDEYPTLRQLPAGYGVLTSTGFGDGTYEVRARLRTYTVGRGHRTTRVEEIRVVFVEGGGVDEGDACRFVQVGDNNEMVVVPGRARRRVTRKRAVRR